MSTSNSREEGVTGLSVAALFDRYGVWAQARAFVAKPHQPIGASRAIHVPDVHKPVDPALSFGGFGLSGFGHEGGSENLDSYLETKAKWIS